VVARDPPDKRNIVGDEAIRAALAGIAVELDDSGLDERRPRWPKFVLAAVGVLATIGIVALVAGVVRRKQMPERAGVRAVAPVVSRGAASTVNAARAATRQVEEVTAPAPAVVTESPKAKSAAAAAGRAVVATISVDQTKLRIAVGQRATLTVTMVGEDGSNIDGRAVSWTSSRKRVATISPKGVVMGRRAGTAKITATGGGKRSSVVVTVTARATAKSQQP
jgi:hypothetical protein